MVGINWCLKQSKGISLIDKKSHLAESYLEDAYDSFKVCMSSEGKWKVITGYYACYDAVYAILMKCGIKSEIHDCTIKLMGFFDFSEKDVRFMKELKERRIRVQYCRAKAELNNLQGIKEFVLKCEEVLNMLDDSKIEKIRDRVKKDGK